MKYLFLLLILIPCEIYAQNKKLSELPSDNTVNATEVIWVYDQGITSKKMTILKLMSAINDSLDDVRIQMLDSILTLRGLATGESALSQIGQYIYPASTGDSLGIGTHVPTEKLDVIGNTRVYGNFKTTGSIYLDNVLKFNTLAGYDYYYLGADNITVKGFTFTMPGSTFVTQTKNYTTSGQSYNQINTGILNLTPSNYTPQYPVEGNIRWLNSADAPQFYNGTAWTNFGGGGSGSVAISVNQIAYGTGDNTVGGNANFLYFPGTGMQIETQAGQTGLYINNATSSSENLLLRNTQNSNALRITNGYVNSFLFNSDSILYARITDGTDYIGITSDMQNNSSKNYIALQSYDATNGKSASITVQTENTYSDVTIDANWVRAHADSIRFDHIVRFYGSTYFKQWGTLPDTMAFVAYMNGEIDTITVAFEAADVWDKFIKPFNRYFREAKKLKALPFANPQGKEIRGIKLTEVPYYQIENEFEHLYIFLKRNWNADQIRTIAIILLFGFLVYQQSQISKLKKR